MELLEFLILIPRSGSYRIKKESCPRSLKVGVVNWLFQSLKILSVAPNTKHLPAMWETGVRSLGQEDSPGEGNGNPLQYSCLWNPMDRRAWWATVRKVAKSRTRLSDFTFSLQCHSMILTKINRDIYINIWLELLDSTLVFILEIGKMWSQSQQFLLLSFLPQMVNRFDCFWRMIGLY